MKKSKFSETERVRTHIVQGNFSQAFGELDVLAPQEKRNEVQLLWTQFNEWQRNDLLNAGAKPEERNRILYATLAVISDIEECGVTGFAAQRARALRNVEIDLAQGYSRLAEIRKKNIIDLFIMWMFHNNQPILAEILRQEDAFGRSPQLAMLLKRVNLGEFIQTHGLNSTPNDAIHFFLKKSSEVERFFSGWMEYRRRRERFEEAYEIEIERCKIRHSKLLKAGFLGGFLGAIGVDLYRRNMSNIAAREDEGIDPPTDTSHSSSDDSDDD